MGRVIDANAMYQAGRGAGPQGVKEPIWGEYIEGLGKMVIDSTVKGFSKLNDFREKSQAQTALIDLKIDKISKDNPYLKNDILSWKVDYDKAAYCAIFGISAKKRSACREQRAFAMAKLTGANELLTTFQKNAGQAQGSMHLENGGTLPGNEEQKQEFDENLRLAPYATTFERNRTYDQGNGDMANLLKFDRKTGDLMYLDPYTGKPISYSKVKFAPKGDNKMVDAEIAQHDRAVKLAYVDKPLPFNAENEQTKIFGRINNYEDKAFKTWYFGGTRYDYNTAAKIPETSLAYKHLIQQAIDDGLYVNGAWIDDKKYGPGSADWETKLTRLKLIPMHSGSKFRHEAARESFTNFKTAYDNTIAQYALDKKGWETEAADKDNKWNPTIRWNDQHIPRDTWAKNYKPFIDKINSQKENIGSFTPLLRGQSGVYALRKKDGVWQEYTTFVNKKTKKTTNKWVDTTIDKIGIDNSIIEYITSTGLPSNKNNNNNNNNTTVPKVDPLQDKVNKERLKKREEALKMLEIKKNRYTPEEYEQKIKDIDNKYPINEKKAK